MERVRATIHPLLVIADHGLFCRLFGSRLCRASGSRASSTPRSSKGPLAHYEGRSENPERGLPCYEPGDW